MEGEQLSFGVPELFDEIILNKGMGQEIRPGDYVYASRNDRPGVLKCRVDRESRRSFMLIPILDEWNRPYVPEDPREKEIRRGKDYVALIGDERAIKMMQEREMALRGD